MKNGEHVHICYSKGGRGGGGKNKDRGIDWGKWHFLQWRSVRLTHLLPAWFHLPITDRYTVKAHNTEADTQCQTALLLKGCERIENGVNGSKMVLTLLPTQSDSSLLRHCFHWYNYSTRQSGAVPSKGGNRKWCNRYVKVVWYLEYVEDVSMLWPWELVSPQLMKTRANSQKKQENSKKTSSLIGQHRCKMQVVHNFPVPLRTSQRHESQTSVTTGLPIWRCVLYEL